MKRWVDNGGAAGRSPLPASESGFTLIEVLVALGITVVALAVVALSISTAMRAHERAIEHLDLIQTERETMNRIYQDLTVTYISPSTQAAGQAVPEEVWHTFDVATSGLPYDALTFNSLNHHTNRLNAKDSDLAIMTLFVRKAKAGESPEGTGLLMLREGGVINDQFEVEGGVVSILATGLTKLNFDYLDTDGELRHEWSLGDRGGNLPCAVVVELGFKTEHLAELESCAVVPLIMSGSQPCRYEKETLDHLCEK
jgi:prepilin-type N-terminal cleavage/methylation domain-containing protein